MEVLMTDKKISSSAKKKVAVKGIPLEKYVAHDLANLNILHQ